MLVSLIANDPDLGEAFAEGLRAEGHTVERHPHFDPEALRPSAGSRVAILLDIATAGGVIAWSVQRLREKDPEALIVVLGDSGTIDAKVQALDGGADDYLIKPVSSREIGARLRALARRAVRSQKPETAAGLVRLHPVRRRALVADGEVALTASEYALLALLMSDPGRVVPRAEIERQVFGIGEKGASNTLEVLIHKLRRKLGEDFIVTVRGRGYRVRSERP